MSLSESAAIYGRGVLPSARRVFVYLKYLQDVQDCLIRGLAWERAWRRRNRSQAAGLETERRLRASRARRRSRRS
jgi:hypothetical protein